MTPSRDDLLRTLAADAMLGRFSFEPVEVAGLEAVVSRHVPHEPSVALWRAARACFPGSFYPILTDDHHVHPDIEPVTPTAPISLDEARAARERVVRASPGAAAALDAIAHSSPQAEAYNERDSFLELPEVAISLVLVRGGMGEAVQPFTPDGEGTTPRGAELRAMLRSFGERHGAEALYADGDCLELEVQRPPHELDELRRLARDFFLLSQGTAEGFGIEDPARLLRRLTSDRWVVWWYGTT